jgi:uncharacterized protein
MNVKNTRDRPYEIEAHVIASKIVSQTFIIKVVRPTFEVGYKSKRFPVLYVTDSDDYFAGLACFANVLQLLGETRPFILVGIGYGDSREARLLRWRDFVTHSIRVHYREMLEKLAASRLVDAPADLSKVTETTDAKDFLAFIREELMPFINKHYPVIPEDNSYSGYSAGGCFGLYTLLTQPDTFKRYIIGSPSTSYGGHHFGIELADAFTRSRKAMSADVFLSVGELEEFERGFEQLDFVTGYCRLTKFLTASSISGLGLTARIFPGETHATAWTLSFNHGLRTLLPPIDSVPDWRETLK